MAIFKKPKTPYVPPPPYTPTAAQAAVPVDATPSGLASMVSTGSQGLTRKPEARKRVLIGG